MSISSKQIALFLFEVRFAVAKRCSSVRAFDKAPPNFKKKSEMNSLA